MAYEPGMVDYIRRTASNLGINPSDLATAISYETGGKFDQNLYGGAGGKHLGLIQFGPEEQAKYGVKQGMPLDAHFSAVENFLRDRGLKPGMGMFDLYSTINAGRPGLYNASDENKGGMPGTVADKVAEQMAGHRIRANAMLGGENVPANIQPAVQAAGARDAGPIAAAPDAQPTQDTASQAGSLNLEKLIGAVGKMPQQQEEQLQPVPIAPAMNAGVPAAQRLAAVMQALGSVR